MNKFNFCNIFFLYLSRNGVASLKSLVPDTITQWIATSFVVNPQSGLGVAAESANVRIYVFISPEYGFKF